MESSRRRRFIHVSLALRSEIIARENKIWWNINSKLNEFIMYWRRFDSSEKQQKICFGCWRLVVKLKCVKNTKGIRWLTSLWTNRTSSLGFRTTKNPSIDRNPSSIACSPFNLYFYTLIESHSQSKSWIKKNEKS